MLTTRQEARLRKRLANLDALDIDGIHITGDVAHDPLDEVEIAVAQGNWNDPEPLTTGDQIERYLVVTMTEDDAHQFYHALQLGTYLEMQAAVTGLLKANQYGALVGVFDLDDGVELQMNISFTYR